jgi:Zn-dependent alcohol dehydrogenase
VLVIGAGGVGLSAVMAAHLAGAGKVIVADLVPSKLELARRLGATDTIDAGQVEVVAAVRRLTEDGVDYAFEAIGLGATMAQAFAALRRRGVAVAIGSARPDARVEISAMDLVRQERTLTGSSYGSSRPTADVPRLIDLYRSGRLPLDLLLSRRYPLDAVNDAFRALLGGEVARSVLIP